MRFGPIIGGLDDVPLGPKFPFVREGGLDRVLGALNAHLAVYFDEFAISGTVGTSTAGTGSAAFSTTTRGGAMILQTGGTAGGLGRMNPLGGPQLAQSWQHTWWFYARIMFGTAYDTNGAGIASVMGSSFGFPEVDVGFVGGVGSGTELGWRVFNDAGTLVSSGGTGIPVDVGVMHDVEVANEGQIFRFAIDGKEVAKAPVPASASVSVAPAATVSNGATAANRSLLIKRWAFVSRGV